MHVVVTHEKDHRINYFYLIRHVIYYQFNQNSNLPGKCLGTGTMLHQTPLC